MSKKAAGSMAAFFVPLNPAGRFLIRVKADDGFRQQNLPVKNDDPCFQGKLT